MQRPRGDICATRTTREQTERPLSGTYVTPGAHLAAGIGIALILSWGPIGFMGWFLTALVHELGHTLAAWFFGCPAWPAIRLDGHAAAFHQPQVVILCLLVWAGIGGLAWRCRSDKRVLAILIPLMVLYPVFAFTGARDVVHLLAGHLSELVFATVFFWRALTGGFVKQEAERPLYAALGWLYMGRCVILFGGLAFTEAGRQAYAGGGSFGLVNDLIRVAAKLDISLATAAIPMLLLSLAPLPLAFFLPKR
jgi:hypothetical protein